MNYPNTPRTSHPLAYTDERASIPINHSSHFSPNCSHRTSRPPEKSQPSICIMPARETYKNPQVACQSVTPPPFAISSFLYQLPLLSSSRNPSAATVDGAPLQHASGQASHSEAGGVLALGPTLQKVHKNTQKKCIEGRLDGSIG